MWYLGATPRSCLPPPCWGRHPRRGSMSRHRYESGWGRNDRAELEEQTEVVARGPVFGDQTIGDPEDVDVLHRVGLAECGLWNQLRAFYSDPARRHLPGRSFWNGSKRPAHSHATYNFVVFRDHVVDLKPAVGKGSAQHPKPNRHALLPAWRRLSVAAGRVVQRDTCPELHGVVQLPSLHGIEVALDQSLVRFRGLLGIGF